MFGGKKIRDLELKLNEATLGAERDREAFTTKMEEMVANATDPSSDGFRARVAAAMKGSGGLGDTLHSLYFDFGYPEDLTFANFKHMYKRFGIAQNVVELPPEMSWMRPPAIESENNPQFNREVEKLIEQVSLFQRMKGLDIRQRVGRYAGMFMRVRDNRTPDQPIASKMGGVAAIVGMIPLYEDQLKVLTVDEEPTSERFDLPITYQFNSSTSAGVDRKSRSSFTIHHSRIVIAAEGADDGSIYGVSTIESVYNSLMDLIKIIGGGGEGFYKNAAQSVIFNVNDAAALNKSGTDLAKFNEHTDDWMQNRMRRSMATAGMDTKTLTSDLITPKDFFTNALNDVAAGSRPMIPATLLVGQQTGRLASQEDSRGFLAGINSRNENFVTSMVRDVIDWCILFGILPSAQYTVEWDDLLSLSDTERLEHGEKMATINELQFKSGGELAFTGEEIREASGFETEDIEDPGGEDVDEDTD